eukprot:jgi/Undpi1/9326/HiC_scaffold_26.g11784.m1
MNDNDELYNNDDNPLGKEDPDGVEPAVERENKLPRIMHHKEKYALLNAIALCQAPGGIDSPFAKGIGNASYLFWRKHVFNRAIADLSEDSDFEFDPLEIFGSVKYFSPLYSWVWNQKKQLAEFYSEHNHTGETPFIFSGQRGLMEARSKAFKDNWAVRNGAVSGRGHGGKGKRKAARALVNSRSRPNATSEGSANSAGNDECQVRKDNSPPSSAWSASDARIQEDNEDGTESGGGGGGGGGGIGVGCGVRAREAIGNDDNDDVDNNNYFSVLSENAHKLSPLSTSPVPPRMGPAYGSSTMPGGSCGGGGGVVGKSECHDHGQTPKWPDETPERSDGAQRWSEGASKWKPGFDENHVVKVQESGEERPRTIQDSNSAPPQRLGNNSGQARPYGGGGSGSSSGRDSSASDKIAAAEQNRLAAVLLADLMKQGNPNVTHDMIYAVARKAILD